MSLKPMISVIVPVYNASATIKGSVESLLSQSFKKIQIILVNDASTDGSGLIIDRFALENESVVALHLDKNEGVHEARLVGLKHSSAPWIGFLDADDFARSNMFSTLIDAGEKHNVDIVVCGSDRVTFDRKVISKKLSFEKSKKIEGKAFERFCNFEFGTGMLWNKLFRRSVIEPWFNFHFPWRQNINEDLLLNLGCFYSSNSVYLCNEILHEYSYNEFSVTSKSSDVKAFVDTYRAAAIAIKQFSSYNDDVLYNVIDLYRKQLSWKDYCVDNSSNMSECSKQLLEAVDLIQDVYPTALAFLSVRCRSPERTRIVKLIIRRLYLALGL